ncbi:MAG TPA: hypothetical protein PL028_07490, partial [Bacteroidales bacterium]|nr:hypothetical protein [Bacteroidales bacterium]
MIDISVYFEPVDENLLLENDDLRPGKLANIIRSHIKKDYFPSLEDTDIAIIGVKEDRNALLNQGTSMAPDEVRKYIYKLYQGNYKTRITDLGNIIQGHQIEDT